LKIATLSDVSQIESAPLPSDLTHRSIFEALSSVAQGHPTRKALTFVTTVSPSFESISWTHQEFLNQIIRAANLFTQLAGGEEPRIAMLLPAIPQAYFTLFGGETAGVVCPINYLLGTAYIAELLNAAKINILVALGPHAELDIWSRVTSLQASCPSLKHVLATGGEGLMPLAQDFDHLMSLQSADQLDAPRDISAHTIAALFHTGGTTGKPKLAQHTHGNQVHAAYWAGQMYASTADDVMLNGFPLFHVAGSFVFGLSTLLAGGEVVLPTLLGMRSKALVDRYWEVVALHKVTLLAAVPTLMTTILGLSAQKNQLQSVRALLTGGSPLPEEVAARFEKTFAIPVRNILGMTECAGVISIEPMLSPRVAGSCGLALPFTQVQAVSDDGQTLAPNQSGVLRVRGPNVGPGYTEAERNHGTFTQDGWLITGDIGHIDVEGRIFITGRQKDLIIRSSHNIDPRVIEDALQRHPDVVMAAAVGEPDEYAGEIPVAYVTLRPGASVDPDTLREFAQQYIPERPAFAKRVEILSTLPMTAIGKVYKPALKAMATQFAIEERLMRAGLNGLVKVSVPNDAAVLSVVFTRLFVERNSNRPESIEDSTVDSTEDSIREIMSPFAIAYRLTE
jgi:fatty-acyl-CoA synthase